VNYLLFYFILVFPKGRPRLEGVFIIID